LLPSCNISRLRCVLAPPCSAAGWPEDRSVTSGARLRPKSSRWLSRTPGVCLRKNPRPLRSLESH